MKELINFWEETVRALNRHELDFDKDVIQIESVDGYIEKELFKTMAMTTNYERDDGSAKIRMDFVITGKNWWFERKKCNGKERWKFFSD